MNMQRVYSNPTEIERYAKKAFGIPDFLMMENAAACMYDFILSLWQSKVTEGSQKPKVLIACGKGNNGGDGYALARKLQGKADVSLFCLEEPISKPAGTAGTFGTTETATEAAVQFEMCKKLGLPFIQIKELHQNVDSFNFIIDCLYGTGFRGELKPQAAELINLLNAQTDCIRIACDIPTAFAFKADYTISMGTQKLAFYSDEAKQACGKIIVADLGIAREKFESAGEQGGTEKEASCDNAKPGSVLLVEKDDVKLPVRKNKAAHKGTYGHTAVFAGNKSGAAIISATAAMNFGSGLTTLVKQPSSNLEQFKLSPELMISDTIPKKTTCVVLGPGTELLTKETACAIEGWFDGEGRAAVLDAGMFGQEEFIPLLTKLCSYSNARIVLTPHLLELVRFCKLCGITAEPSMQRDGTGANVTVQALSSSPETKIKIAEQICKRFPGIVLVIKSANTFICDGEKTYIVADGAQSLAKGGSGDVLSGMLGALLAQGYSALDAAITACESHALAATQYGPEAFDLTPEKLIATLREW